MNTFNSNDSNAKNISAIILAAGKSTRFKKGLKQYIELQGKKLYEIVRDKAAQVIGKENCIVVGIDCKGGKTRSQSVYEGLKRLNKNTKRVIILESARPLVTLNQIQTLVDANGDSISFVMPTTNTVIYRNGTYINRNDIYDLLVPQIFDYQLLYSAYKTGKYYDYTDETRVMFEEYGIKPNLIETGQNLFKITYQSDVALIKEMLSITNKGEI